MPQHDFASLYAQYPTIIEDMPDCFNSHEFFLQLARQHQALYIEALYSYRRTIRHGKTAPFQSVHVILAKRLAICTDRIKQVRKEESKNIFNQLDECTVWEKI